MISISLLSSNDAAIHQEFGGSGGGGGGNGGCLGCDIDNLDNFILNKKKSSKMGVSISPELRKSSDPSSASNTNYSIYHSFNNSTTSANVFAAELTRENSKKFKKSNKSSLSIKRNAGARHPIRQTTQLARSLSEPAACTNRNQLLMHESPTIKLLVSNLNKKNANLSASFKLGKKNSSKRRRLAEKTNGVTNTSCSILAFKRSFSYTNLLLEQRYVKKSTSFDKFLQNVVKGKQKSMSLCNFNLASSIEQQHIEQAGSCIKLIKSLSSNLSKSSDESENLEQMMMMIMNNTSKSNWPVLKIEDSLKGSLNELPESGRKRQSRASSRRHSREAFMQTAEPPDSKHPVGDLNENELYIPNNVRSALESAGINIEQIIKLTSKLEMSFGEADLLEKPDEPRDKCSSESLVQDSAEPHLDAELITGKPKPNSQVISISNKSFEVIQNLSATNNFCVAKHVELSDSEAVPQPLAKPRKRLSNIRYATIGNFTLPSSLKCEPSRYLERPPEPFRIACSPSWASDVNSSSYSLNSHSTGGNVTNRILPAKQVAQFKPVLNVHKRASTIEPVALHLNQLSYSASIDSFLMPAVADQHTVCSSTNTLSEQQQRQHQVRIEEHSGAEEDNQKTQTQSNVSTVDLSKSLPNRNKKKVSVTRSFSYTIGNLTGSHMPRHNSSSESPKAVPLAKSVKPMDANKGKTSFSLLSDALGLGRDRSKGASQTIKENSSLTNLSVEKIENSISAAAAAAAAASSVSKKATLNGIHLMPARVSLIKAEHASQHLAGSAASPLYLLPTSISNAELKSDSASTLLAFARANSQDIANVYDFQHVSTFFYSFVANLNSIT